MAGRRRSESHARRHGRYSTCIDGPPWQRFAAKTFARWAIVRSTCRREARHNIKLGDELSDPRSFNRRKSTVTAA